MNPHLEFLSISDIGLLTEITHGFLLADTRDKYIDLFCRLKAYIPFECATSGLVTLNSHGDVEDYDLLNINFTDEWMNAYSEQKIYLVDVTVEENFKHFKTQCWSETYKKHENPKKLLSFGSDFNLTNGYSCGSKAFGVCKKPSMISFVWNFKNRCNNISRIIDHITPYIHISLSNILQTEKFDKNKHLLTNREKEVLSWVKAGKGSWEISVILGVSQATVNFHVTNAMRKLESTNRLHAVATALQNGIIDFD